MDFNSSPYNEDAYNQSVAPAGTAAPTSLLVFDGFDCDDRTYMTVQDMDFSSAPERQIDQYPIPRANGVRVSNVYGRGKIITAWGILDVASVASGGKNDLETRIDILKKNLRGTRKKLTTNWGGKLRLYTATLQNTSTVFKERKRHNITYTPFMLEFLCEDAATDWSYDDWTDEITTSEDTVTTTGNGTTEGKPVVIVVFSAATGVDSLTCSIDENGQQIGYSGAITAGGALVFDSENETVTLNGVEVDFTGYFPAMALDTNTFRFVTNGSSRTFRVTIKSKHAYL